MTIQPPASERMPGDGAALLLTLSFGHSQFWVTNTNTQWLVWPSHKMQARSVAGVWPWGAQGVDPTCRTEAGSQVCPGSWGSSPGSAVPLLV